MSRIASVALVLVAVLVSSSATASASRAIGTPGLSHVGRSLTAFGTGTSLPPDSACYVTMRVTLESSIAKTAGAPLMTIDPTLSTFSCYTIGGAVTGGFHNTAAFGYTRFAGTLPAITEVQGTASAPLRFWVAGGAYPALPTRCEYTTSAVSGRLVAPSGLVRTIEFAALYTLTSGPASCLARGIIVGTVGGLSLAIPLTLI